MGCRDRRCPTARSSYEPAASAVRELFRGIGVTTARAHEKRVPMLYLPGAHRKFRPHFLRGLFGADGCVSRVESGGKASRYVGLGSRSNG